VTHPSSQDFTELLVAWGKGEEGAMDRLMPLVYQELRRTAHRQLRGERPGQGPQTTSLVHEAYMRLLDSSRVRWQNRSHFYAVSAQLMRRILVDFARARRAQKRGGDAVRVPIDEALDALPERRADVVALDDALEALAQFDPRKVRVVELRFFGGLSVEETADVLSVSPDTVMRDWKLAKAWLLRELSAENDDEA
jgi:RNA polymerase sigma-70 factor (ECF subfamily)